MMNKLLRGLQLCGSPVLVLGGIKENVKRAIVFLHGSGDSGLGMATWLKQLGFEAKPDTVLILPSAPTRPYTLAGGERSAVGEAKDSSCDLFYAQVWHDRRELNINAWEDNEGIKEMARSLDQLVQYKSSFANNDELEIHLIYTGGRNS